MGWFVIVMIYHHSNILYFSAYLSIIEKRADKLVADYLRVFIRKG